MPLILRPFSADDEMAAREARRGFQNTEFEFLFDFDPEEPWEAWTSRMERYYRGIDLPAHRVRAAFLAADVDGVLVGAVSIRFEFNDFLATRGGHIGYGVLRQYRRLGYATAILRAAVDLARTEGLSPLLVTCADANVGSVRVIENCGGRLEAVVSPATSEAFRRYWL